MHLFPVINNENKNIYFRSTGNNRVEKGQISYTYCVEDVFVAMIFFFFWGGGGGEGVQSNFRRF